jgi:sec-independent protein translocase protein TatA
MFRSIGATEILLIALVILLLFGGTKIPSLMRGLGQGIREFRKEMRGDSDVAAKEPKGESSVKDKT